MSEGTAAEVLDSGPGHYTGSALPGQPGDAGIAGHRVTHGGPFRSAGELRSCDPILVETAEATYVYRVLPLLGVPARPGTALLTLTTCHPEYSDRERLVVHAVLTSTTSARS